MNGEGVFSMKYYCIIRAAVLFAVFVFLTCPSGLYAEIKPGTINITPSLGSCKVDGGLHYSSGMDWGIGVGLNLSDELGSEFNFNAVDSKNGGHAGKILLYRFDILFHLTGLPLDNAIPYVSAGAGFASFNNNGVGNTKQYDLICDPGFGLKYYLNKHLALRGDARYILDFTGNDLHHNLLYNAGLTFEFGLDDEESTAEEPIETVKQELCPPAPSGCVENDWCKKDSDGDGVPDCIDKCPGTPAGCPVDKDGCPKDTDGDGVPDCLDKCPDTPKGIKVDADGCPPAAQQGAIIFRNILFDFGKANLKPESFAILDQVVEYLMTNPGVKMEIQGHTDNKGTAEFNMKLSSMRADSVRKYLVGKGVPSGRLEVKGFGLTKPIVPNDTEGNRARNRRVEFKPI
jgi:OmpA-OmpF porin, OOP family